MLLAGLAFSLTKARHCLFGVLGLLSENMVKIILKKHEISGTESCMPH